MIAVDPAVIPLGTAVDVRLADGKVIEAIALDTGGAIKGAKIDVLMSTRAEALEFGKQAVQIRIIKETVK
ncbi:Cell wall-binding protein YocH precursor [compost metagenome]